MKRWVAFAAAGLFAIAVLVFARGWSNAHADPVVRQARIALPGWPVGAAPVRLVLASDIHLGNSIMDTARLTRLVERIAALRPDLVLLAGDFIAGHDREDAAVAGGLGALVELRPRLGVVAVPGNHDHWTDYPRVERALTAAGVTVLRNGAAVRGPLVVGGIDDIHTRHARIAATLDAMARLRGTPVMLSHSPDVAPQLPRGIPLLLAGHTHCGQIFLPWLFPPQVPSNFGPRYRCGMVREGGRLTLVTAGLGTSVLPLRFGAPPDLWLLTLGP